MSEDRRIKTVVPDFPAIGERYRNGVPSSLLQGAQAFRPGVAFRPFRRSLALVFGVLLLVSMSGCFLASPSQEERAQQLARDLESSDLGIMSAQTVYHPTFSGGLTVDAVFGDEAMTTDHQEMSEEALGRTLRFISRAVVDMRVGSVYFHAENVQGADISVGSAAEKLGLGKSVDGDVITLTGEQLRSLEREE